MQKCIHILLIALLLVSCKPYVIKEVHFRSETRKIIGEINKIDSTDNQYVFLIKNDTLNAVFSKPKLCGKPFNSNINLGKLYSLVLKTDAANTYEYLTRGGSLFPVEDKYFEYENNVLFLVDCLNICGKTIDCKENLEFKKEFFSNIKTIDSLIYRSQNQQFNKSLGFISKYSPVTFESKANYTGRYPVGAYKQDRQIWIDWYEKNKCTNIQFKE
jgi:hypothetical protein